MSLKQTRFYVEPALYYKGLSHPEYGNPESYMDNIVSWVAKHEHIQGPTCYALWKIKHQEQRIDALEGIVKSLIEELHAQREAYTIEFRRQETLARDLRQFQECQMDELREKIKDLEPIYATELPYAKVVECPSCGEAHEGSCSKSRPFMPLRRPFVSLERPFVPSPY